MSSSPHRSFAKITDADLRRLTEIAHRDFTALCQRTEHSRPYADKLRLLCLCQGAARHHVYGDRGVQDFDVWGFFESIPNHPFPYRRRGIHDYGESKFGRNPDDGDNFKGRRVDVIGRSIDTKVGEPPVISVQRYLQEKRTTSARLLSERPVIALWPNACFGQIIWDTAPVLLPP